MLPINLPQDQAPDSPIRRVVEQAMPAPTQLSSAPTTAGGQLQHHGDWGHVGDDIYINLSGTVYKFTGTAV